MILVDTSVWVHHLRSSDAQLVSLLNTGSVLGHPWVIGELSLGTLSSRRETLDLLGNLPRAIVATDREVARLIDDEHLHGLGIGYVDAQLLASTRLTPDGELWTADKRLDAVAARLGVQAAGSR